MAWAFIQVRETRITTTTPDPKIVGTWWVRCRNERELKKKTEIKLATEGFEVAPRPGTNWAEFPMCATAFIEQNKGEGRCGSSVETLAVRYKE